MNPYDLLAHNLHVAAALNLAFDCGQEFGRELSQDSISKWFPGSGHPLGRDVVGCVWCSTQYPAISIEHRQGLDCAAGTYEKNGKWYLSGHYGSREADMTAYEWRGYPYSQEYDDGSRRKPMDPICDVCIRKLVADGTLVNPREWSYG